MSAPDTAESRSRFPVATLAVLGTGAFASGTDSFVIAGLLPEVAADLDAPVGAVGLTVTLFAVAYALGAPVLVAAAARIPPKRTMLAALALFVLANLAAAAAPTLPALGGARILAALGAGVFMPGAITTAASLGGPARRGRATAVVVGGASLALVLGVPLGTLAGQLASWRASFLLVALLGLLALLGVAALVTDPPPATAPGWRERLAVLRRPGVTAVLAVTLLANTAAFAVYTYLGPLFPRAGPSGVAWLVLGFGLGAILGTWAGGRAADRFGASRVAIVVVAVFAVNHFALGLLAGSLVLGVGYAVLWGLSGWATIPAQQSRLIGLCGPASVLALSANSSATHLGTGLGALAGAAVISAAGAAWIPLFAGAVSLLALVLVVLGARAREGVPA